MIQTQQLRQRREEILRELQTFAGLRKGYLNEQYFPVVRDGKQTGQKRGPYYVWTYKEGKKTVSKRLTSTAEIAQARKDAAAYARFKDLCRELEELLATLREEGNKGEAQAEALKKKSRPKSGKVGKSSN